MRVAWDLQAITGPKPTGLGTSVRFLLEALRQCAPAIEVIELRPNDEDRALIGVGDRLAWEQWRLPHALRAAKRNVGAQLCYSPALGAPLASPVPVVCHVHDLIPLRYPRQFSGVAGWYWKNLLPYTWRRCARLSVSNQTVADDIVELLGYPPERIQVVPYYPDPLIAQTARALRPDFDEIGARATPDEPLFITLASHELRKNIELAIRALGVLSRSRYSARLVCVGGITPHTDSLKALAREHGVLDRVEFPGYLEREQLVALLLDCTALLFVSRYEGFGMPPLEAMSVGCAVVLSGIACHRHIYGDQQRWRSIGAGDTCLPAFVGVDDDQALAEAMKRLIDDPAYRSGLRSAGLAYAATFAPQATADALRRVFLDAAGA